MKGEIFMTYNEAIKNLMEACQLHQETIELLQKENAFLCDTIVKHNLGEIVSERRALLAENERYKKEAEIAIKKAEEIRKKYEVKTAEIKAI